MGPLEPVPTPEGPCPRAARHSGRETPLQARATRRWSRRAQPPVLSRRRSADRDTQQRADEVAEHAGPTTDDQHAHPRRDR